MGRPDGEDVDRVAVGVVMRSFNGHAERLRGGLRTYLKTSRTVTLMPKPKKK
jgi:hypothetical protein